MDEIDDILGKNNKSTNKNNYYRSNNYGTWQDRQSQERKIAYDTMEKMAISITQDGNLFKKYIDLVSRFEKYSVGNNLLILAQNPNSKLFRDKKSWNEKGIELIANPQKMIILEPTRSEKNSKVYYNPKEVFDITQTTAKDEDIDRKYETRELLKAFFYNCGAKKVAVDELPNGTIGAEYNKEENTLYVCRGMDVNIMFQTISQELVNIDTKDEVESDFRNFKTYCISYMICKKYGIDVSNYEFDKLPKELTANNDGKEIRKILNDFKMDFESLNSRISEYFENSAKEKKNKVQER